MNENFHEGYFSWLVSLATDSPGYRSTTDHYILFTQMHVTQFRWTVRNDENRNEDGKALRGEFLETFNIYEPDTLWLQQPASVLEVLIALSRRASFEAGGTSALWIQLFLHNLELNKYVDFRYNEFIEEQVFMTLQNWMSRNYGQDGTGGLFPLRYAKRDQRRIEIWYQLAEYVAEGSGPQ